MIYPGYIVAHLAELARQDKSTDRITIDNHQANGAHGIHQARAKLANDPTTYRIIIAPADAPIYVGSKRISEYFIEPLGDS